MPSKLDFLPAIELCNSLVQEPQPMYHRLQKHWMRGIPHTDAFPVDVWDHTFDTPPSSPNFLEMLVQENQMGRILFQGLGCTWHGSALKNSHRCRGPGSTNESFTKN